MVVLPESGRGWVVGGGGGGSPECNQHIIYIKEDYANRAITQEKEEFLKGYQLLSL